MSRILVADDSYFAIKNLKQILTKAGHEIVAEVTDGEQACREYRKHKPDLVTIDITMPVMGGLKAIRDIIREFPDAKIVVISASTVGQVVFEALQNGARHYIFKPFYPDEIINVIDKVLKEEHV
ncbi:MAG: response regulator [Clostridia bacterium]|nr:response regulator [Clostridia bacterium]